jgi:hypothetical protein
MSAIESIISRLDRIIGLLSKILEHLSKDK